MGDWLICNYYCVNEIVREFPNKLYVLIVQIVLYTVNEKDILTPSTVRISINFGLKVLK